MAERAAEAGLSEVLIYLGDLRRRTLHLLVREAVAGERTLGGHATALSIDGTVAGRSYQHGRIIPTAERHGGLHRFWVPLRDSNERLGVLHIASATDDEHTRADMMSLAALVGMMIIGSRGTSDSYTLLTRTRHMDLAAEMQWELMAPRTYADGRIVVGAAVEPAYEAGGDAYDYAVTGDGVHLSIFDAMGHDTAAGLTVNLALSACRTQRRRGAGLAEVSEEVDRTVGRQFGSDRFVTAILAHLDTSTGVFTWVNRGHPPPTVIRDGRWTSQLASRPAHPLGTELGLPVELCSEHLQPGDRIVLYTDGITEARKPGSQEFGLGRFTDFLIRHNADGLPVPETVRRFMRAVLDHHDGHLQDDATILLCEWLGPTRNSGLPQSPTG
ncbi:GAF domain-containing SpoIIE family protein phosphatase [Streptomyces sp. 150FB]|uniref:PP2C family protein-serine/threonine phosphatase n=1 Tax=Streptomyces sp. 150FB TaxID=1576605 RepID=UPI000A5F72CD|nr:GAF domain-containing SpoIIE family protein phosphatase [Streptomyces sp. 150FB]